MPTLDELNTFLEKDLVDTLKWLFVGAVVWKAAKEKPERCCHQKALGMFTCLVQARALSEFYFGTNKKKIDDTRAAEFCTAWQEPQSPNLKYISGKAAPANKRIFHLIYGRSGHSGGRNDDDRSEDLNEQVLVLAKELLQITQQFANCVKPEFNSLVLLALDKGLQEAQKMADCFEIANPL